MRSSIDHSGALNDEPQFTFRLVEMKHAHIVVDGDIASLRREVSATELRDLILRARYALEDCRLRGMVDRGALTWEGYEQAKRDLDKQGPPLNEEHAA